MITYINQLEREKFFAIFSPVLENFEPLLVLLASHRPYAGREDLVASLNEGIDNLSPSQQIALICQFPRLASRQPLAAYSLAEHAAAGINALQERETQEFDQLNAEYLRRFSFPLVLCARDNQKSSLRENFRRRLQQTREQEIIEACEQIKRIFWHRIEALT
jgi:OHCU decarboxylase